MKRPITFLILLHAAVFLFLITGCKKESDDDDNNVVPPIDTTTAGDSIAPVITLNGNSALTISLNGSYTDAGATATDAHDGNVSVTSNAGATNPDVNLAGDYTITYTAQDSAGNTAQVNRTVTVRNDAYYLAGTYSVVENGVDNFTQTISASATVNNRVLFSKFANYSNNSSIFANITGTSIAITTQVANGIGASGCDHVFNQAGPPGTISIVLSKAHFTIQFSDEQLPGGVGCPGVLPIIFDDEFTQQ